MAQRQVSSVSDQQRKANLRLALMLAGMAVLFGVAFVAKVVWLGW